MRSRVFGNRRDQVLPGGGGTKCKRLWLGITIVLFAELGAPSWLSAQNPRYKFVDIATLGGSAAEGQVDGAGLSQYLNEPGVVVGGSDTLIPDPNAPNNCINTSCFLSHGFRWQEGVLTDLGALSGANQSHATSINSRGWATGGSSTATIDPLTGSLGEHAVLWRDGGIFDLGTLGTGVNSAGLYVNNAGEVVGFATVDTTLDPFPNGPWASPIHAFIWRGGVMRDLGTLGGLDSSVGGGCNNQRVDLVAGWSYTNLTPNLTTGVPTQHAFLWQNGVMTDIPTLGGTFAFAQCANNQGEVIGQSNLAGDAEQHAFLWNHGSVADLQTLGGSFSIAIWLNDAGEAVGGATTSDDTSFHATLWKNGQITDLGTVEGDCFSVATAINSSGQIIGQSSSCDGTVNRGVVWINDSIIDLNAAIPPNSTLQLVETDNINDHGEIVGRGLPAGCENPDACGHVFLLIPCAAVLQGCSAPKYDAEPTVRTASGAPITATQFISRVRARLDGRLPSFRSALQRH